MNEPLSFLEDWQGRAVLPAHLDDPVRAAAPDLDRARTVQRPGNQRVHRLRIVLSYDRARPGTWQQLVAFVETTPNTAGGHLAIERSSLEGRIAATIRLDDVRLELLDSP